MGVYKWERRNGAHVFGGGNGIGLRVGVRALI